MLIQWLKDFATKLLALDLAAKSALVAVNTIRHSSKSIFGYTQPIGGRLARPGSEKTKPISDFAAAAWPRVLKALYSTSILSLTYEFGVRCRNRGKWLERGDRKLEWARDRSGSMPLL